MNKRISSASTEAASPTPLGVPSKKRMRWTRTSSERLGSWFAKHGYTLLVQGTGLPTPRLLEQFREARKAVTDWQLQRYFEII